MKVLIIDDEQSVREGLTRHMQWNNLGFSKVDTAASAEEALEYIETNRPELIISDIRLPKMNGIELCRIVRERKMASRIIFISGYFNREYVKGAIHLSVDDYIEKPIIFSEIEKAVKKSVAKIRSTHTQKAKYEETEEALKVYFEQCQESALRELLRGNWAEQYIQALPDEKWNIQQSDSFAIILVKTRKSENEVLAEKVHQQMQVFLKDIRYQCINKTQDTTVFLLSFGAAQNMDAQSFLERLCWKWENTFYIKHIAVTVSDVVSNYTELPEKYFRVNEVLKKVFYRGFGKILTLNEETTNIEYERGKIPFQAIQTALMERNKEKTESLIQEIYTYLQQCENTLPDLIKMVFFEINSMLMSDTGQQDGKGKETDDGYLWMRVRGCETIQQCYEDLMIEFRNFFEDEGKYYENNTLINKAVNYISRNYGNNNLSVKDIAEEIGMTPGYLTAIFRGVTGLTLGNYIKSVRLTKSSEYLERTELTLKEIAERCGYTDSNYFAKVFKKEYGLIPSEYRNRKKK